MAERQRTMSEDLITQILLLGQEMRDDIRTCDDPDGMGARWDALMREVTEDPSEKAKREAAVLIRKLVKGGIVAMREGKEWLQKNAP